VSDFFRELLQTGIYKRSQGRITRQATFAALLLTAVIGCWKLSYIIGAAEWNYLKAQPADVVCQGEKGHAAGGATVEIAGTEGKTTVTVTPEETLTKLAATIDEQRGKTGVAAQVDGNVLHLKSKKSDANGVVKVRVLSGSFPVQGLDAAGQAMGRDQSNLGFQYLIPGVVLALATWIAYRLVNMPAAADFLIAVEAEMNKVSRPTRHELIRASLVVLVTMFLLTVVLYGFDFVWGFIFHYLHVVV